MGYGEVRSPIKGGHKKGKLSERVKRPSTKITKLPTIDNGGKQSRKQTGY